MHSNLRVLICPHPQGCLCAYGLITKGCTFVSYTNDANVFRHQPNQLFSPNYSIPGKLAASFNLTSAACVLCSREVAITGKDDCLGARPYTKFVEKIGHMIANRLFTDCQVFGNLCITKTFCNQCQDFPFAW